MRIFVNPLPRPWQRRRPQVKGCFFLATQNRRSFTPEKHAALGILARDLNCKLHVVRVDYCVAA